MGGRALVWITIALVGLGVLTPSHARAAEPAPPKAGLFITPVREYITTDAKQTTPHTLTVANFTDKPMTVTLSVEQFTVADYSYDYQFTKTDQEWIHFVENKLTLNPNQNQAIAYTLTPPAKVAPGGHYLTILATATLDNGTAKTRIQAATLLYITIEGNLDRSSLIKADHIPGVLFGGDIHYTLTVQNTGNTHFFVYVYGELQGLSAKPKTTEVAHLLLPLTSRTIGGTIPAPLLPGLYHATYGYTADGGQQIERTHWVLYLPVWSLAMLAGLAWVMVVVVRKIKRARRSKK
jgi:hypothetical protein